MADVQLSKNFYLSELLISNTATRLGIENTPTEQHLKNLKEATTNLWQPTRDLIGHPMSVSSGYRNPRVNSAVGGEKASAHPEGFAIDFISPGFGTPKEIALFLVKEYRTKGIKFDQIIFEFGRWIHLGYKHPKTHAQRGQVLTAKKVNGKTVYINGIVNV